MKLHEYQIKSLIDTKELCCTALAFLALDYGKKIRNENWCKNEFVRFDSNGIMVDENNNPLDITIDKGMMWYILD